MRYSRGTHGTMDAKIDVLSPGDPCIAFVRAPGVAGRYILLALLLAATLCCEVAGVTLTLVAPPDAIPASSTAHMDILAVNPAAVSAPLELPSVIAGRLAGSSGSWVVELRAENSGVNFVAANAFVSRRYVLNLPADAHGRAVLELDLKNYAPLRAVVDIGGAATTATDTSAPSSRLVSNTRVVDAVVNRTFAGRLTPNDPIYFIYGGGDEASAKFQFSFNYRVASFDWGKAGRETTSTIQLGYTQRSLWDIDARSSPFYDTSYMPEIALETMVSLAPTKSGAFTWIGLRTGFLHESNGRDGEESRSLNIAYVRPMIAVGPLDSWHLVLFPEVFTYVRDLNDNKDIKEYRGYGRFRAVFGKNNGPSLLAAVWAGKDFDHVTYQLDLAYPIRTRLLNIESFLLLQYFDGYGESLRAYQKKSHALRLGIALLR